MAIINPKTKSLRDLIHDRYYQVPLYQRPYDWDIDKVSVLWDDIDKIDDLIIESISKRIEIVKKLAEIKNKENYMIFDEKREKHIIREWKKKAQNYGIDSTTANKILQAMLEISKKTQRGIIK